MAAFCTTCCGRLPATRLSYGPTLIAEVSIRPFAADDLPRLQTIREAAFCPVFQSFRGLTGAAIASLAFAAANEEQAALLERLCRPDPGQLVFVAERASEIVGFVCVSLNRESLIGEIGLNAVDPSHAGKGIGTQLYEFDARAEHAAGDGRHWR